MSVEGGARAVGYGSINASILASTLEDYEQRVVEQEDRINNLAADLLEERSQRQHLGEALVRVTEERDGWKEALDRLRQSAMEHGKRHQRVVDEWMNERAQLIDQRDEVRAEVVKLGRRSTAMEQRLGTLRVEREQLWRMLDQERDELDRLRTIIGELGAAEAAEPPDHFCAADCDCKPAAERGDAP